MTNPHVTTIHDTPAARSVRLSQLRVDEETLRRAVAAGLATINDRTPHSTLAGPGVTAWDVVVRTLRDLLKPTGLWRHSNSQGRGLVICDEHQLLIEPTTGNSATGTDDTPRSSQPRGVIAQRTLPDRTQLSFMTARETSDGTFVDPFAAYEWWTLLFYFDVEAQLARLELSRPTGLDSQNRLALWGERILLGPTDPYVDGLAVMRPPPPPTIEEPAVDIRRRTR